MKNEIQNLSDAGVIVYSSDEKGEIRILRPGEEDADVTYWHDGIEISAYEFFERHGEYGEGQHLRLEPTHNFKHLLYHRYQELVNDYTRACHEWSLHKKQPTQSDTSLFVQDWYEQELKEFTERLETAESIYRLEIKKYINVIKQQLKFLSTRKIEKAPGKKRYTPRQIRIAYLIMGIPVNKENAEGLLKKFSKKAESVRGFLYKQFPTKSELSKLSGNPTADTKHLADLKAAKQLISGEKNMKGLDSINDYLTVFETAYNNRN